MQIFLFRDEQQVGPFTLDEIGGAVGSGDVSPDELAWREGLQEWSPLRQVVDLSGVLPARRAPSPPPLPAAETKANRHQSPDVQQLIGEEQDPAVVSRLLKRVSTLLTRDEKVAYIGAQKKPIVTLSPDAIVLTNRRFMIVRPKLMGMTFEDYQWREVVDVHMSEHMLSATISCRLVSGYVSHIDHIPKRQARKIYA
jgi:ribosomal protein S19